MVPLDRICRVWRTSDDSIGPHRQNHTQVLTENRGEFFEAGKFGTVLADATEVFERIPALDPGTHRWWEPSNRPCPQ